jgi:hypothetical protein
MISALVGIQVAQTSAFIELVSCAERAAINRDNAVHHEEIRNLAAEARANIISIHEETVRKLVHAITQGG